MNIQLLDLFLIVGEIWVHMKGIANHEANDIHGLKRKFLKWVANDSCDPITSLFILVLQRKFQGR